MTTDPVTTDRRTTDSRTTDRSLTVGRSSMRAWSGPRSDSLADVLERVLDKGVVIVGDVVVSVLDVELLTLKLRLFIASADTAREMGLDWWTADPFYNSNARSLRDENQQLRERLATVENAGRPLPPGHTEQLTTNTEETNTEETNSEDSFEEPAESRRRRGRSPADAVYTAARPAGPTRPTPWIQPTSTQTASVHGKEWT